MQRLRQRAKDKLAAASSSSRLPAIEDVNLAIEDVINIEDGDTEEEACRRCSLLLALGDDAPPLCVARRSSSIGAIVFTFLLRVAVTITRRVAVTITRARGVAR